jgi:hypothetical protein
MTKAAGAGYSDACSPGEGQNRRDRFESFAGRKDP